MTVGFEVYTDGGILQVNHNLANPVLVSSGTVTTTTKLSNLPATTSSAVIAPTWTGIDSTRRPLLALRPPNQPMFLTVDQFWTGSAWSWSFAGMEATGVSIPYWIFDNVPVAALNYGLEIYDASGVPTFRMQSKPLRIRQILSGTTSAGGTFEAGRTYACVQGRYVGGMSYGPGGFIGGVNNPEAFHPVYRATGCKGITDGISLVSMTTNNDTANGTLSPDYSLERNWNVRSHLIVDVTNY